MFAFTLTVQLNDTFIENPMSCMGFSMYILAAQFAPKIEYTQGYAPVDFRRKMGYNTLTNH